MKLWAFARLRLGLTDDEFDFMPQDKFDALTHEWRRDIMHAELCATIMNQNPHRTKAVTADQLLGDDAPPTEASGKALVDALKLLGKKRKKDG